MEDDNHLLAPGFEFHSHSNFSKISRFFNLTLTFCVPENENKVEPIRVVPTDSAILNLTNVMPYVSA